VVCRMTVAPPTLISLPNWSFDTTVTVAVELPSAGIERAPRLRTVVAPEGGPATKSTAVVATIGLPLIVPLTTPVPATVLVRVAVYVPLLWSVTADIDPTVVWKTTVAPPTLMTFSNWSKARTVIVAPETPSAVIFFAPRLIDVVEPEGGPGAKSTPVGPPIALPLIVPVMLAWPATVPLVSVAVYVPFPWSVAAPTGPGEGASTTGAPPTLMALVV